MITRQHHADGSWSVRFKTGQPVDLDEVIKADGHVIFTRDRIVDIDRLTDAQVLAAAYYVGVVWDRDPNLDGPGYRSITGPGLRAELGYHKIKGPRRYTADTLANLLDRSGSAPYGVLRNEAAGQVAIRQGTVTDPTAGATVLTGTIPAGTDAVTALEYLIGVHGTSSGTALEYRINPAGTLDVGPTATLFPTVTTPSFLVASQAASDETTDSITAQRVSGSNRARHRPTKVWLLGTGIPPVIGEATVTPPSDAETKDLHGATLVRVEVIREAATSASNADMRAAQYAADLTSPIIEYEIPLSDVDVYQLTAASGLGPGDGLWVYYPERGISDLGNTVTIGASRFHPELLRVLVTREPNPKGVYYRDSNGTYTDLSDFVEPETGVGSLTVATRIRPLAGGDAFTGMDMEELDPTTVPNPPSGLTVDGSGVEGTPRHSRGYLNLSWTAPTVNTDGSLILDEQDFVARYRPQKQGSQPAVYPALKSVAAGGTGPPTGVVFSKYEYDAPGSRAVTALFPDASGAGYSVCRVDTSAVTTTHVDGTVRIYTIWLSSDQGWTGAQLDTNLDVEVRSAGTLRATLVATGEQIGSFHEFQVTWDNDTGGNLSTYLSVSKAVGVGVWGTDVTVGVAHPVSVKVVSRSWEHMAAPWDEPSVLLEGLVPGVPYEIGVRARDVFGNRSSSLSGVAQANDAIPAAPTVLAAVSDGSLVYQKAGRRYGGMSVTWVQSLNQDGGAIEDGDRTVIRYRITGDDGWQRQRVPWEDSDGADTPDTDPQQVTILGLVVGAEYTVQAHTVDRAGRFSKQSTADTVTIANDATAPSTPAAPVVSWSRVGQKIKVRHDLTKSGGGNLEDDLWRLLFYCCTAAEYVANSNVVPVNANHYAGKALAGWADLGQDEIVHRFDTYGKGTPTDLVAGTTYWVAVVAQDQAGNKSAVSAADSCATGQLVNADEFGSGVVPADVNLSAGDDGGTDSSIWMSSNYNGTVHGTTGRLLLNGTVGWALDGYGNLDANAGRFRGTIYAESGVVGGWTIGASTLVGGDVALDAAGKITAGTGTDIAVLSGADPTYRMWIGAVLGADAPFKVTKAGAMTALSGVLGSLSVTGTQTLAGSGKVVTAASGQRVEITATDLDRVQLFSGHDDETGAGVLTSVNSTIDPDAPLTMLTSPSVSGLATVAVTLRPGTTGSGGYGGAYISPIIFEGSVSSAVRVFSPNHLPQADTELDGPTIGTWTPTLTATTTNPTLSTDASHTVTGEYTKVGNLVKAWVFIEFGTTGVNAGSGQYLIDTPTTAAKPTISGNNQPSVGSGTIFDSDGADAYLVDVRLTATTRVRLRYDQQTASGNVGAAIPFTWAASDRITIHFEYLEA